MKAGGKQFEQRFCARNFINVTTIKGKGMRKRGGGREGRENWKKNLMTLQIENRKGGETLKVDSTEEIFKGRSANNR